MVGRTIAGEFGGGGEGVNFTIYCRETMSELPYFLTYLPILRTQAGRMIASVFGGGREGIKSTRGNRVRLQYFFLILPILRRRDKYICRRG